MNAPIFLFSKHPVDKNHPTFGNYYLETNKPLLPDPFTLLDSWLYIEEEVKRESAIIPWESKKSKLYWRGQSGHST